MWGLTFRPRFPWAPPLHNEPCLQGSQPRKHAIKRPPYHASSCTPAADAANEAALGLPRLAPPALGSSGTSPQKAAEKTFLTVLLIARAWLLALPTSPFSRTQIQLGDCAQPPITRMSAASSDLSCLARGSSILSRSLLVRRPHEPPSSSCLYAGIYAGIYSTSSRSSIGCGRCTCSVG